MYLPRISNFKNLDLGIIISFGKHRSQPFEIVLKVLQSVLLAFQLLFVFLSAGGRLGEEKVLTEEDWALEEYCTPYEKSKTLAEKAAWELVKNLPGAVFSLLYCARAVIIIIIN